MVIRIICAVLISLGTYSYAQDVYIKPGLLSASLTFAPSTMLNHGENNFYLTGVGEYFLNEKFSFFGESFIFLNSQNEDPLIQDGIRTFFGGAFHINRGNWDASLGFQPGFSIMNTLDSPLEAKIEPSAALRIGTNYYFWKYFHFFANLTYTKSKLFIVDRGRLKTDELIFSAGLGFQIQTKKKR